MYTYLLHMYQQWCSGLDAQQCVDGERFIKVVHHLARYNEDEVRRYLVKQPWFKSEVNEELL